MSSDESIWFRIGHAWERARLASSTGRQGPLVPLSQRRAPEGDDARRSEHPASLPTAEEMILVGSMFVLDRIVGRRAREREPGVLSLLRAGLSGAAAALVVDLVRPILEGEPALPVLDRETGDRLLGGFAQGLLYGALVEPRVPGPALVKGALYGTVEYAADPMGGLGTMLAPHTPQGRLPVLGELFASVASHERVYVEHLVFGIALALLYESSAASNGIVDDADGA